MHLVEIVRMLLASFTFIIVTLKIQVAAVLRHRRGLLNLCT